MSDFIEQQVLPQLADIQLELIGKALLDTDAIKVLDYQQDRLSIHLQLGYPDQPLMQRLRTQLEQRLSPLKAVATLAIDIDWRAPANVSCDQPQLQQVRNMIAVASGKGGVGKSTTCVNLALALAAQGARVGILDADIYGPSQAMMLGLGATRPKVIDEKQLQPHECFGVKSMSMGYLADDNTPMIWRGPMASGALQQLLFQTQWQALDYLLIDMPPGTGDIALTLSQRAPLSGALVVTTPQDIALLDAKKAVEMFAKVDVPVLGMVENMAIYHCPACGHQAHIFGKDGGAAMANALAVPLLGALPLDIGIRQHSDQGEPSVVADPDSAVSQAYLAIAKQLAGALWQQQLNAEATTWRVSDD